MLYELDGSGEAPEITERPLALHSTAYRVLPDG